MAITDHRADFYSTVNLLEYIPTTPEFDAAYEKTIYYAVDHQDTREFCNRYCTWVDVTYPHAPWCRSNLDYKLLIMVPYSPAELPPTEEPTMLELVDKEFYGRIKINNLYVNDRDYYMENLIIRYIHRDATLPSMDLIEQINHNIWRKDMRAYVYIPFIIYILQQCIRHTTIQQL
jgi:hypothetical protein